MADEDDGFTPTPPPSRTDILEGWAREINEVVTEQDARLNLTDKKLMLLGGSVGAVVVGLTATAFSITRILKALGAIGEVLQGLNQIPQEAVRRVRDRKDIPLRPLAPLALSTRVSLMTSGQ